MGVREDDGMHLGGANRQWMPVALAKIFQTLKQSAINKDAFASDLEQMFGTGDRTGRAEKSQRHAKYPTCPPVCQNKTVDPDVNAPVRTRAMSPAIALAV